MRHEIPEVERMILNGRDVPAMRFTSFQQAVEAAKSDFDVTHCHGSSRKHHGEPEWDLGWGFNKAIKLAHEGWPEGHSQVRRFADRLDVSGRVAKPEVFYDVTGDAGIDMGRFMQGEPECFMDWRETETPIESHNRGKIVQIVFNFSASAGVTADVLCRRGASCMALIDALETAGRRVELIGQIATHEYFIEIPLKDAIYQPQEDQIAYALVAPAFFRRLGFSLIAQCGPEGAECARGGYGMPSNHPTGDIYFPAAIWGQSEWSSDRLAMEWIERILKEQGVELTPLNT